MKTFEVQFISRYYEEKIHSTEIINANSEKIALKKFAKLFNIKDFNLLLDPNFSWDDGLWIASFKCIKEINEMDCPHCNGNGKISINY